MGAKVEGPISHEDSPVDQHKIPQYTNAELQSSNLAQAKHQIATEVEEKDWEALVEPVKSLVHQNQVKENTMSKQITGPQATNDTIVAEEFTNDEIVLFTTAFESLSLKEKGSAIVPLEENRYEKRLDFKDKKSEDLTALNWKDWRKVDLQSTEEIETFLKENADARSLDLSGNPFREPSLYHSDLEIPKDAY